ncbi:Disease resistance protein [Melia azedarach]|uniref:Disease resistance protein n=1 Tax=Melia azedarach TaxID=155640 RepID=A0ACC1YFH5_MELAZ|nr:Disease resistance protein [Melia azedarach]
MADIIVSIAIEVVKCVAKCIAPSAGHRIGYLREYKSNFQKLEAEVEKLKNERTSVQQRVDAAKRNIEEIEENVQKWLERAEEIEKNAQELLERVRKNVIPSDSAVGRTREDGEEIVENVTEDEQTAAQKRCFKGLCPDLKMRYQLSKEAVMHREVVVTHLDAWVFDQISHPRILKDPQLSIKDYEAFESRASTLTEVIRSLKDPHVNIVGIYGMGGIGKTTLAKAVVNHPEISKFFDSVIFVEITEKPDKMQIQRRIGEKLLDEQGGCKLLLTARSIDVLSSKMDSQRNFPIHFLSDQEAWSLFQKMAGNYIEDSQFKSTATEITNKCARLPIVIVTIAKALANKPLFVWIDVLQQMRISSSENVQDIHESIELSYNHLETEILKKTLLLIRYANLKSMDELLIYGMGLSLFEGINDMDGRRVRVRRLVQQLKDSCLLIDSNTTGEDFSMHDIVRDVAMSVASRDRHVFTNELLNELEWPNENTLKVYPSIFLEHIETGQLPQVLQCHEQLKVLSISAGYSESDSTSNSYSVFNSFLKIRDEFFTRMTELKVLVLANTDLSSLPSSLRLLTNVRALGLHNCCLEEVAVGELKKMEILSLRNSKITQLPAEIGHLTRLKLLDLKGCICLSFIPPNVISSLSNLEELYMSKFFAWEEEGLKNERKKASIDELKRLPSLTCLEIQIPDTKMLPRDLFFNKLKRYKITIGRRQDLFWPSSLKSSRKLKLSLMDTNICFSDGHILQLKGIEQLWLVGVQDMKSVLYGLDKDGFPQLKYLQVGDSAGLVCIIDPMKYVTCNAFPVLESLRLMRLINLEKICYGQFTEESFSQLRRIIVERCDKLANIFSLSFARRFQLLQSIDVSNCQTMEAIFAIEREDGSNSSSEVIDKTELSQLRSLKFKSLHQLRSFCSKSKTLSMSEQRPDGIVSEEDVNVSDALFAEEVVLPNLEVLELDEINVERIWQNQVATMSTSIQNLKMLILSRCGNLRSLFSSSTASSFVRLQHIEILDCGGLEEIVAMDNRKEASFPHLEFLKMTYLENLTKFCSGGCIEFPSLKKLEIGKCHGLKEFAVKNVSSNQLTEIPLPFFNEKVALPHLEYLRLYSCDNLRCLFSSSTIGSFVRLQRLEIFHCPVLEVIFDLEDQNFEDQDSAIVMELSELDIVGLPRLKHVWNKDPKMFLSFERLNNVSIEGCDILQNVFPASIASNLSQLESLKMMDCGVEEIVLVANEGAETNNRFVFPRVISLTLENLPNCTMFFPGIYTSTWPALKELNVNRCPMNLSLQESDQEGGPQFLLGKFSEDLLCKLKHLVLKVDKLTTSSLDFLQGFENMKMLIIQGAFNTIHTVVENGMLAQIGLLNWCPNLKHILKEDSNMDHLLHLEVDSCDYLINLASSSTSFRNLTTLEISSCYRMTNVMTSSTAKSLVRLRIMRIHWCSQLTEIVATSNEDEAKDHEIVLRELTELQLCYLESLTIFCSANCILKFPSLEEITVENCPKMKSFSGGKLSTPRLQKVKEHEWEHMGCWKGDLNTTIQHLHEETCKRSGPIITEGNGDEEDVTDSASGIDK